MNWLPLRSPSSNYRSCLNIKGGGIGFWYPFPYSTNVYLPYNKEVATFILSTQIIDKLLEHPQWRTQTLST
jgi:hypothetical protein